MQSKTALVMAGQGAQSVGMGRDLAEWFPGIRALFERADTVLETPLTSLCFEGPEEELVKSHNCQPAIFVVSVACARALESRCPDIGSVLAALAGLSLGEWTALHLAGVLEFDDCLRLLQARGRFMQEACEQTAGAMLSVIGLDAALLQELAGAAGVEVANFNSPEQTVLSGPREAVADVAEKARAAGAKRAVPLNVAGAYHSGLMRPAAEKLAVCLKDVPLKPPVMPVLSNVTGLPHGTPEEIRAAMVAQVTSPVRWVDCVRWMHGQSIGRYVECGPGRVLSGLIKRIVPDAAIFSVHNKDSLEKCAI